MVPSSLLLLLLLSLSFIATFFRSASSLPFPFHWLSLLSSLCLSLLFKALLNAIYCYRSSSSCCLSLADFEVAASSQRLVAISIAMAQVVVVAFMFMAHAALSATCIPWQPRCCYDFVTPIALAIVCVLRVQAVIHITVLFNRTTWFHYYVPTGQ